MATHGRRLWVFVSLWCGRPACTRPAQPTLRSRRSRPHHKPTIQLTHYHLDGFASFLYTRLRVNASLRTPVRRPPAGRGNEGTAMKTWHRPWGISLIVLVASAAAVAVGNSSAGGPADPAPAAAPAGPAAPAEL